MSVLLCLDTGNNYDKIEIFVCGGGKNRAISFIFLTIKYRLPGNKWGQTESKGVSEAVPIFCSLEKSQLDQSEAAEDCCSAAGPVLTFDHS